MNKDFPSLGLKTICQAISIVAVSMSSTSWAAISPVYGTTNLNTSLEINFSSEVQNSNVNNPVLRIIDQPVHGSYIACASTPHCIVYTPDRDFSGIDVFSYTIEDSVAGTAEPAQTITINVGGSVSATSGTNATLNALLQICVSEAPAQLDDFCSAFRAVAITPGAIPPDLRELLSAISPQDLAAQAQIGNDFIDQQLSNIGRHLASLRSAQTRVSLQDLSFHQGDRQMTASMLASWLRSKSGKDNNKHESGGGASADGKKSNFSYFGNGSVGNSQQSESEFESGFEFVSNGVTQGIDYQFGNKGYLGLAIGFARSKVSMDFDQGQIDADGSNLIAYGSFYPNKNSYLDIVFTSGNFQFETERHIVFGTENSRAYSDNKSHSIGASINLGYRLPSRDGWSGNLEIAAQSITTTLDKINETGDSLYTLTVEERKLARDNARLGGNLSYAASFSRMVVIPQLDLHVVHFLQSDAEEIVAYFNEDPNQTVMRFNANEPDTTYIQSSIGVSMLTPGGFTGYLQFSSSLSRDYTSGTQFAAGIRLEF